MLPSEGFSEYLDTSCKTMKKNQCKVKSYFYCTFLHYMAWLAALQVDNWKDRTYNIIELKDITDHLALVVSEWRINSSKIILGRCLPNVLFKISVTEIPISVNSILQCLSSLKVFLFFWLKCLLLNLKLITSSSANNRYEEHISLVFLKQIFHSWQWEGCILRRKLCYFFSSCPKHSIFYVPVFLLLGSSTQSTCRFFLHGPRVSWKVVLNDGLRTVAGAFLAFSRISRYLPYDVLV